MGRDVVVAPPHPAPDVDMDAVLVAWRWRERPEPTAAIVIAEPVAMGPRARIGHVIFAFGGLVAVASAAGYVIVNSVR
jgi:hypothetical protein